MTRSMIAGLAALLSVLLPLPSHGQWVEPPGTGWLQVQVAHQSTQEGFDKRGNVVPLDELDPDARSITTTVRFTGALGLVRGIDTWFDFPIHRQEFNGVGPDLLTTGIGDLRLYLRAGPRLFGIDGLPVAAALRGGVKLPSGNFENDAESISLSQGQRDWMLLLELGKSLHPWPVYVMGWTGYRWREENEQIRRDPGNEWLFYTAAGGSISRFQWKVAVDGVFGEPSISTATGFQFAPRELVQLIPTVGWSIGPGAVQAGLRVPLHGQSTRSNRLPASSTFTVGYFLNWNAPFW